MRSSCVLVPLLFVILSTYLLSLTSACSTDADCWYNGVCTQGQCRCDKGWTGTTCGLLSLAPAPIVGAYGYSPNVTSWGGIPVLVSGTYHLYVAEMVDGCGLCTWGSNSRVVHAVSDTILGPYKFFDDALPVWSHNPQIAIDNSTGKPTYLLFHIGTGSGGFPRHCNTRTRSIPVESSEPAAGGVLHTASSPNGPWTPFDPPGLGSCNNPAPYIFPNGTIFVVCTWFAFTAPSIRGPYTRVTFTFSGNPGPGTWEDPFVWWDNQYGVFKLLSHVYEGTGPHYADRVAGYGYSRDGHNWVRSDIPPFDNKLHKVDGSVVVLTTRERPKLFFDGRVPIALFNGVAAVPNGDKDQCGVDWTYTLAQPIK